jgi:hypothetical protein
VSELALWLACVIPVLCMGAVALGVTLFAWRVIARTESAHRDMLKAVLVVSVAPAAPQLAGMMESADAAADKAAAEAAAGRAAAEAMNANHRRLRPAH